MVVGILRLSLSIPAAGSLKDKRHVVRKIVDRVKGKFDVAIAEVGENDIWQRAQLGIAMVANDRRFANEVLDKVRGFIEQLYLAPILDQELELLSYGEDRFGELSLKDAVTAGQWADWNAKTETDEADIESEVEEGDRK
jgi:uncharacterized protein YlxP (DUF503 family)